MGDPMTIGRLAEVAGVNVETVRYYQRRGLIKAPHKPPRGQRRYAAAVVEQLFFIRRAQQLGFTLEEVRQLQEVAPGDFRSARLLAEGKRQFLKARIEQLGEMVSGLERFITLCKRSRSRGAGCAVLVKLAISTQP